MKNNFRNQYRTRTLAIIISAFIFCSKNSFAQTPVNVGINYTGSSADASALLDVNATNKGILIPRVALTDITDATTITNPAHSLLVYNDGTGGLSPTGYYYNSGSSGSPVWVQLLSGGGYLTTGTNTYIANTIINNTGNFSISSTGTQHFLTTSSGSIFSFKKSSTDSSYLRLRTLSSHSQAILSSQTSTGYSEAGAWGAGNQAFLNASGISGYGGGVFIDTANVYIKKWDPLESTCRHASLSIL